MVVHHAGEERALLGTMLDAALRHAHLLIPLQHVEAGGEQRFGARERDHLVVGVLRIHGGVAVVAGCRGVLDP